MSHDPDQSNGALEASVQEKELQKTTTATADAGVFLSVAKEAVSELREAEAQGEEKDLAMAKVIAHALEKAVAGLTPESLRTIQEKTSSSRNELPQPASFSEETRPSTILPPESVERRVENVQSQAEGVLSGSTLPSFQAVPSVEHEEIPHSHEEPQMDPEFEEWFDGKAVESNETWITKKHVLVEYIDRFATYSQVGISNEQAAYERYRAKKKNMGEGVIGKSKWVGRTIGKGILPVVALPWTISKISAKTIDVLLPTQLQTTPKLDQIDALRNLQKRQLDEARKNYELNRVTIEAGYEVLLQYVRSMNETQIAQIDCRNIEAMHAFMYDALNNPESQHYIAVQQIISTNLDELNSKYEEEIKAIEQDNSGEVAAIDIWNSSWIVRMLRTAPSQKAISAAALEAAAPQPVDDSIVIDTSEYDDTPEELELKQEKEQVLQYVGAYKEDAENEAEKILKKNSRPSIVSRFGKRIKGAFGLFKPTALGQIERLRKQKKADYESAQQQASMDIQVLSLGHAAVYEFVENNYGSLIVPRFDTGNEDLLRNIVDSLYSLPQVLSIKERQIRERENQAIQEENRILGTNSSEDIKDLAKSSRLIRARDAVRSAIGLPVDYSEDEPDRAIASQPTLMMLTPSERQPVPQTVPSSVPFIASNANNPSEKTTNSNQEETHSGDSSERLKTGGGTPPPSEKKKRRSRLWALVPAAAAGIAALLLGSGDTRHPDKVIEKQQDTVLEPPKDDNSVSNKPFYDYPAPSDNTPQPKSKVETIDYPPQQNAESNSKPASKPSALPVKPKAAKTHLPTQPRKAPVAKVLPKTTQTEVDKKDVEVEKKSDILTENQKTAKIRAAQALVDAYISRIDLVIQRAQPHLHGLDEEVNGKRAFALNLEGIPTKLNTELQKLYKAETVQEAEQIMKNLHVYSPVIASAEKTISSFNVGVTESMVGHANLLLAKTKKLAPSTTFTIAHHPKNANGVVPPTMYSVDINHIQTKLAELDAKTKAPKDFNLSPREAELARMDSQYWTGYLQFVNWNLQYNKTAVTTHSK